MFLDRVTPPNFKEINSVNFIKPTKYILENNIPVFVINAGDQELVRIEFIFKNLNWNENNPLLASTVNAMLTEGTDHLSAAEIASKIDYCGAFLQPEFSPDHSTLSLYTLNKQLPNTLPIVKDVLQHANFPEKELQIFIRNHIQKLKINEEKNDYIARKKFNQVLFGNSLYGYNPTIKQYEKLQQKDLQNYYRQIYQPQNCTIIIAGNVKNDLIESLNQLFKSWINTENLYQNVLQINDQSQKIFEIRKSNSLQAAIKIGMPSINKKHEDYPEFQILNTVLGGYFGSRLMNNIREDKGYTYGIGSGLISQLLSGAFIISTEVGVDVKDQTLIEIEKEINLLKTQLIGIDELNLVKNYLMGSLLGSLENAFSHADKFKGIYFYDLEYSYYDNYIHKIKNIDAKRLNYLAKKYLDFDNFYKIIVF